MAVIINEAELAQRVAVVKRFKELLIKQRERFSSYLALLDKQQIIIDSGNTDELIAHVELEEQIVADIFSIQKVIDPMEDMYNAVVPYFPANDVPALKTTLEDLKSQAIAQSQRNQDLLSSRMAEIRKEIKNLRNNPFMSKMRSSIYQNTNTASLIDIKG